jgi:hypothetical protein
MNDTNDSHSHLLDGVDSDDPQNMPPLLGKKRTNSGQ